MSLCSVGWMWGDPHFVSVDNLNFTFNGIGEYFLIHTPATLGLNIQARLQRFDTDANGTIMTAVVFRQSDLATVQIEARNSMMELYIGGIKYELTASDSPLLVTDSGVMEHVSGGVTMEMGDPMAMMMANQVSVRFDEEEGIVVSTGEGASLSVALQMNFLRVSLSLSDSFVNMTSGLMGIYNNNPEDDFQTRDGEVLSTALSESEVYQQFGLGCKCSSEQGPIPLWDILGIIFLEGSLEAP